MQINLSNKTALITGASGDLGRVMAHTLAGCGASVAIHYHSNQAKAETLRAELSTLGTRAMIVQADVGSQSDILRMRDEVGSTLGAPDIIVNNAVSQYEWKTVLQQPMEDYEGQFKTNVLHNVLMAQAFVPAMIEKNWGRIVAISTECAIQCAPTTSAYVSGKRGMDGVLRTLAREVGEHGITVNQVAPGWTISDRDRQAGTELRPEYSAKVPLRRRGEDQDIANAVAWFASDLAGFVTGAFLPVCGGHVMTSI